jgi:hypothetical protein
MLKLFVSAFFVILFVFTSVYETVIQRVEQFFSDYRFNELQSSDPSLISFFHMKVEQGLRIVESKEVKKSFCQKGNKVFYRKEGIRSEDYLKALNHESFNILDYRFLNHYSNKSTHLLIDESTTLLINYSNEINNNMVVADTEKLSTF